MLQAFVRANKRMKIKNVNPVDSQGPKVTINANTADVRDIRAREDRQVNVPLSQRFPSGRSVESVATVNQGELVFAIKEKGGTKVSWDRDANSKVTVSSHVNSLSAGTHAYPVGVAHIPERGNNSTKDGIPVIVSGKASTPLTGEHQVVPGDFLGFSILPTMKPAGRELRPGFVRSNRDDSGCLYPTIFPVTPGSMLSNFSDSFNRVGAWRKRNRQALNKSKLLEMAIAHDASIGPSTLHGRVLPLAIYGLQNVEDFEMVVDAIKEVVDDMREESRVVALHHNHIPEEASFDVSGDTQAETVAKLGVLFAACVAALCRDRAACVIGKAHSRAAPGEPVTFSVGAKM